MDKLKIEQIKRIKYLEKQIHLIVPQVYSCFAKVMYEDLKMDADEIEAVFNRTQEVWQESVDNSEVENMIEWCKETTGIDVRSDQYV